MSTGWVRQSRGRERARTNFFFTSENDKFGHNLWSHQSFHYPLWGPTQQTHNLGDNGLASECCCWCLCCLCDVLLLSPPLDVCVSTKKISLSLSSHSCLAPLTETPHDRGRETSKLPFTFAFKSFPKIAKSFFLKEYKCILTFLKGFWLSRGGGYNIFWGHTNIRYLQRLCFLWKRFNFYVESIEREKEASAKCSQFTSSFFKDDNIHTHTDVDFSCASFCCSVVPETQQF